MQFFIHLLGSMFLVAALVSFTGCTGGSGAATPPTVQVGGTITYGGSDWPYPATLSFVPIATEVGSDLRSTTAKVALDGKFAAETFSAADGLVPGTYKVAVQCWDHDPADGPGAKNFVPKKYQSHETSGLKVVVPQGEPEITVSWDVPKI